MLNLNLFIVLLLIFFPPHYEAIKNPLISAALPFVRKMNFKKLNDRLNSVLKEHIEQKEVVWRPERVVDFRGYTIPSAAERLSRWDQRRPDEVFKYGLLPPRVNVRNRELIDLYDYVLNNKSSLFVGTTRSIRLRTGHVYRWTPRNPYRFEYDIYAVGGIDINLSLGDHKFMNQREIAFFGGVRRQLIRCAREYLWYKNGGKKLLRIIRNPFFDLRENGDDNPAEPSDIPELKTASWIPVEDWEEPNDELKYTLELNYKDRKEDIEDDNEDYLSMENNTVLPSELDNPYVNGNGSLIADTTLDGDMLLHPTRAAFLNPRNKTQVYFFSDNMFALMQALPQDHLIQGPSVIEAEWPTLKKVNFAMVDAVLPVHNSLSQLHVFYGTHYAHIDIETNKTTGPFNITDYWPSLEKIGFTKVDAVLPHPMQETWAFFFHDKWFALVQTEPKDVVISGPHLIIEKWASLRKSGFNTVDVAVPRPSDNSQAYFFSNYNYIVASIDPSQDEIFNTPFVRASMFCWGSIISLGFYGGDVLKVEQP